MMSEDDIAPPVQFSVIMATLNVAGTLKAALDSVAAQREVTVELLVADGGSRDGTGDMLERRRGEIARLVREPDRGVYDAWNKLLPHARGEWILFLGADDELAGPDVLQEAGALLSAARPDYGYGLVELIDRGRVIERFGETDIPPDPRRAERYLPFSHTALFHHRTLFERFGIFDADYRIAGDSEFLTRTLIDPSVQVVRLPMLVARMGAAGMSASARTRMWAYAEHYRGFRQNGIRRLPPWLAVLWARAAAASLIARTLGPGAATHAANVWRRLAGKPRRV